MTYVCVDASVAAKWVLPEEHRDKALSLYEDCQRIDTVVVAPPHLPIEVTNVIRRSVARRLITHDEGLGLLGAFPQFSVQIIVPPDLYEEAFNLAKAFSRPTVYDTRYVALAKILDCDLWTADQGLLNAVADELPNVKSILDYPS